MSTLLLAVEEGPGSSQRVQTVQEVARGGAPPQELLMKAEPKNRKLEKCFDRKVLRNAAM